MDAKPADFFINIVEFFAILLPGAAMSYAGLDFAKQHIFGPILPRPEGATAGWAAFAITSYVVGHFCSQVGATFLDPLYKKTYLRLKRGRRDDLFSHVCAREAALLPGGREGVEPYKWARTQLQLWRTDAVQEIDRLEADSKFFRSMTVVLLLYFAATAARSAMPWPVKAIVLVLGLFSFWTYSALRWKYGQAAFLSVASLEKGLVEGKAAGTSV